MTSFLHYFNKYLFVKACLFIFVPLVNISLSFSQVLPDTLHYNHNTGIAGTQWAFTAVQITDVHLGETSSNGDYGTTGWNDTIDPNTNCPATEALRNAVQWINNNVVNEKIELVLVTGDISDRGEKSGFIMAKRILDSLTVPYIVTNGNHDLWPRISGDEAPVPFGDSVFAQVFAAHFQLNSQQLSNWNDGTRLNRVFNPLNTIYSQFQNFSFSKGSYRFIVNDFATRYKKPIGVGTMTDAALYDISGGSYPWLANAIAQAQPLIAEGTILVQHFPPDNETLSSTYSFSSNEYDSIIDLIEPFAAQFGLCIAGHRHRNKTYNIKRSLLSPVLGVGIETDANSKYANGMLRMIRFWDFPTAHIEDRLTKKTVLFPNPMSEKLSLQIDNSFDLSTLTVEIFNVQGQQIRLYSGIDTSDFNIERGQMQQGLYILILRDSKKTEALKLIVN